MIDNYPVRNSDKPGNSHAMNTQALFPSSNAYGIPDLASSPLSAIPDEIVPYRYKVRHKNGREGKAVHFFIDDYRFETTWQKPGKALQSLKGYQTVLTPDFSLYTDYPRAMQIWNIYRSRWCGCYWQSLGFSVIPSVTWSDGSSFDFCFLGLPSQSLLAVSTIGVKRNAQARRLFQAGYEVLITQLNPSHLLCYGNPFTYMESDVALTVYPHYRASRVSKKQAKGQD